MILLQLLPSAISLFRKQDANQHLVKSSLLANICVDSCVDSQFQVNPERLWGYLTELPPNRFSELDRQATRQYLTQTLQSAGWSVRRQEFTLQSNNRSYHGVNIIAEQPQLSVQHDDRRSINRPRGDSERSASSTLIIGAHYDSVENSPGADDNGTGVAATLELAQLLRPQFTNHHNSADSNRLAQTNLSIKLVFFDLEESGLWGSKAFVDDTKERQDIAAAVILEMLGYACHTEGCQTYPPLPIEPPSQIGDFLAVVGDRNHPDLVNRFQSSTSIPVYTLTIPTLGPLTPDLLRSDHVPFWRKGIGAVMVTDTANFRNPHYHRASDRPNTLDLDFFTAATQIVVDALILQNVALN
ncbi:MAG: M28 family peptidase [Cyanobacteria bacterium P01_F01_bin.150]